MRRALFAAVLALAPACGGGDGTPDATVEPDAGPDAEWPDAQTTPGYCNGDAGFGEAYTYVIDAIDVPDDSDEAENLGRDLDGDGTVDNQLGNILSAFAQVTGEPFGGQAEITASVDDGSTLLLASLRPCGTAGQPFATFLGANPNPPACSGPTDTTCRDHFTGSATFDVAKSSPVDLVTLGEFEGETFDGADGELVLQLVIAGSAPITLELVDTRVALRNVTGSGWGDSVIAGAIPEAQLRTRVVPGMHGGLTARIATDCTGTGEQCGCTPDSVGLTMLGIFDENEDCELTLLELQENDLIATLFRPDLDTDNDGSPDALSMGVGVTAVHAIFSPPDRF